MTQLTIYILIFGKVRSDTMPTNNTYALIAHQYSLVLKKILYPKIKQSLI